MKILCVCRKGYSRSVEMKKVLNEKGFDDVLSVGSFLVSQETLDMLCKWSDMILLAKPVHGKPIKQEYKYKIFKKFSVGDDLTTRVSKEMEKLGL